MICEAETLHNTPPPCQHSFAIMGAATRESPAVSMLPFFTVRVHKSTYPVMSAYAVSLSTLPEDCIKQCIKAGNSHKLLQVSKTLQRLTKDTARDVVLQASAGEEFPEGEGLLKKLQGIPRLWHITVLRLRDCKLCCQGGIELAKFPVAIK